MCAACTVTYKGLRKPGQDSRNSSYRTDCGVADTIDVYGVGMATSDAMIRVENEELRYTLV